MPWYYAGRDSQPVGPVSLEELHTRRAQGVVQPDTYVIEHTGRASDVLAWRRFREVFPNLPVTPPSFPPATPPPAVVVPRPPAPQPGMPVGPDSRPDPYYQNFKPTNSWCAWGFALGLISFFFSFACGIGLLLAVPSLLLCIVGLSQVNQNRAQAGKGLAVAGILLSGVTLLVALAIFASFGLPALKVHESTVTEQTSNDSQ